MFFLCTSETLVHYGLLWTILAIPWLSDCKHPSPTPWSLLPTWNSLSLFSSCRWRDDFSSYAGNKSPSDPKMERNTVDTRAGTHSYLQSLVAGTAAIPLHSWLEGSNICWAHCWQQAICWVFDRHLMELSQQPILLYYRITVSSHFPVTKPEGLSIVSESRPLRDGRVSIQTPFPLLQQHTFHCALLPLIFSSRDSTISETLPWISNTVICKLGACGCSSVCGECGSSMQEALGLIPAQHKLNVVTYMFPWHSYDKSKRTRSSRSSSATYWPEYMRPYLKWWQ